jgi:hypothetical protein
VYGELEEQRPRAARRGRAPALFLLTRPSGTKNNNSSKNVPNFFCFNSQRSETGRQEETKVDKEDENLLLK